MTRTLISLTLRQLLGRRRALFLVVLALVPVLVAILYRFGSDHVDPPPVEFAPDLLDTLLLAIVLPITALIFGTAALGAEIEDGTAVYLLTKPIERRRILLVKIGVTSLIILGGDDPHGISAGFVLGVVVGATAYCALFVALSVRTSRALLIGLAYVFVWEAILPSIFDGTRWVSVRQYLLGLADLVSSAPASALEADLAGGSAAVAAALLLTASVLIGSRLISRFEIGERL